MKTNKNGQEFKALELRLSRDSKEPHTIYFKEHSVREHTKDKPSGRTLFIVNIPPYANEKGLANAFHAAGVAKSVHLCTKPNEDVKPVKKFLSEIPKPIFRIAYLVFEKVSELDKALKLKELNPMNSDNYEIKCGMKKWIDEYNNTILPAKVLKENVEVFMKAHDAEIKRAEKREKKLEEEDDEGWVTVTKRGKVHSFARTEKVENKIMTREENKKSRKELKNFYTFQIRESKMKHIIALRQKFEEDKRKIAQIKQSRRFKPF